MLNIDPTGQHLFRRKITQMARAKEIRIILDYECRPVNYRFVNIECCYPFGCQ